jgi:hypothetical protein
VDFFAARFGAAFFAGAEALFDAAFLDELFFAGALRRAFFGALFFAAAFFTPPFLAVFFLAAPFFAAFLAHFFATERFAGALRFALDFFAPLRLVPRPFFFAAIAASPLPGSGGGCYAVHVIAAGKFQAHDRA